MKTHHQLTPSQLNKLGAHVAEWLRRVLLVTIPAISLGLSAEVAAAGLDVSQQVRRLNCRTAADSESKQEGGSASTGPLDIRLDDWNKEDLLALRKRINSCRQTKKLESIHVTVALIGRLAYVVSEETKDAKNSRFRNGTSAFFSTIASSSPSSVTGTWEDPPEAVAAANYKRLLQELDALPSNEATLFRLEEEHKNYRRRDLDFYYSSQFYTYLNKRIGVVSRQVKAEKRNRRCGPILAAAGMPSELADTLLLHRHGGIALGEFICAAAVGTGQVSFERVAPSDPHYSIHFGRLTLTTLLGRYVADRKMFLPPNSPLDLGTPAFMLTTIENDAGEGIDFPDVFSGGPAVTDIYAQFAEAYDIFINQK